MPRVMCDLTTSYAGSVGVLAQAERLFASARYVWSVRHPATCIDSWVESEKERLTRDNRGASAVAWADIEAQYVDCNNNIATFLSAVPARRKLSVRYEDLERDPVLVLSALCDRLGLSRDARATQRDAARVIPAAGGGRDGEGGRPGVSLEPADSWKLVKVPSPGLSLATRRFGWDMGYSSRTYDFSFIQELAEDKCLTWLARGEPQAGVVVTVYGGFGLGHGGVLTVPAGIGLAQLQAPELVDPRTADPGPTEGRAEREAEALARRLRGRAAHLVGYSYGGPLSAAIRSVMVRRNTAIVASLTLIDPVPFGAQLEK